MPNTTTALTAAGETYFADLGRVRASGGATGERSSYGPLANLLNAVGATLAPNVFCVGELADQGAGHPDFGLYAAKQVQQGRPHEGQVPERGVVEVKAAGDDAWLTAADESPPLAAVRAALEDALGVRFEGERGARFFHSTLVQTLFYGVFSAWVVPLARILAASAPAIPPATPPLAQGGRPAADVSTPARPPINADTATTLSIPSQLLLI